MRELPYWFTDRFLPNILGIFSMRCEICFFFSCDVRWIHTRWRAMQSQTEMNLGKLQNSEKLKIQFRVEGTFGDHLWSAILLLAITRIHKRHCHFHPPKLEFQVFPYLLSFPMFTSIWSRVDSISSCIRFNESAKWNFSLLDIFILYLSEESRISHVWHFYPTKNRLACLILTRQSV